MNAMGIPPESIRNPAGGIGSAVLLSLALGLGGCSLAPVHERPQAPVPDRWSSMSDQLTSGVKTSSPAAPSSGAGALSDSGLPDWRNFFLDPGMLQAIDAALDYNRDLRIALARVEEARALYGVVSADRLPNIAVNASESAVRTPADISVSGRSTVVRRFDVGISLLSFELDFWGRVASLSESARASYLATEQARRSFRISLIADTADAYLAWHEAVERVSVANATLTARMETSRVIALRRDAGLASDLDLLQARSSVESARSELISLQRQQALSGNALQLLTGVDPRSRTVSTSLIETGAILPAGLPAEVLARRPDVLAAEERLRAANANIGAARAAFFPRIGLTAGAGTASRELDGLFEAGSRAWTFSPVLSLPIFSGGRNMANLDLAQVRRNIAVADYERAVIQAFRDTADALVSVQRLDEQLQVLRDLESAQTGRLAIAEARYAHGLTSFLDVLDAQRELLSARQGVVQTRRSWLSAKIRLYKALGGGADHDDAAQTGR
jgi:multidrug efflux system outer membrane protein